MIWEREHTLVLFTAVGGVFLSICTLAIGMRIGGARKWQTVEKIVEKRVQVPVEKIKETRRLPVGTIAIANAPRWRYNRGGLWIGDFTLRSKATLFDEKWEHEIKLNARNTTSRDLPVNVMVVLYRKDGEPLAATCIRNSELGLTNELKAREARTFKGEFILAPKHLAAATHILLHVVRP